jgi:ribosome-interacting GTPase 1
LDELKELIWKKLNFMRLYMKKPGREPDMKEPLILKKDSTIESVCNWVHGDMKGRFKSARVWGRSAKFPGQEVGIRHRLLDKDVLELRVD